MGQRRHSGFAQFTDAEKRDEFVRTTLARDPPLTDRASLSGNQPTIVFENLTASEHRKVVAALEGLGRWVEDVQFEPLG